MIKRFFFLFSALVFLIGSTSSAIAFNSLTTHTQLTPELKPASLDNSFQLVSVCFLGGGVDCGNANFGNSNEIYEIDSTKQCINEGFVNSCSTGYCMDYSCPYNGNYGKCLEEKCPTNSSTTCTGAVDGKNACGFDCKKCCVTSCPSGYDYPESQLTGGSGNGWEKDGNDYCDHCTGGKLYKRKSATIPSGYTTCSCGGSNPINSGGIIYYQTCNCCPSCSSGYAKTGNLDTSIKSSDGCGGYCYASCYCRDHQNETQTAFCYERTGYDTCGNTCYRIGNEICHDELTGYSWNSWSEWTSDYSTGERRYLPALIYTNTIKSESGSYINHDYDNWQFLYGYTPCGCNVQWESWYREGYSNKGDYPTNAIGYTCEVCR